MSGAPPVDEFGAAAAAPGTQAHGRRRTVSLVAAIAAVLAVAAAAAWFILSGLHSEETDDAFIAADVYEVSPRIAGRLASVPVDENQVVEAGAPIAELDGAEQESRVAQATAALALAVAQQKQAEIEVGLIEASTAAGVAQAEAEAAAADARLEQEQAELAAADAESRRARSDLDRYTGLSEEAVSKQRLDAVRAAAVSAGAALLAVEKRVASARAEVAAGRSRLEAARAELGRTEWARAQVARWVAEADQARAVLGEAELALSYTRITAPARGRVTNKTVQPGDYVQPGRVLCSLVAPDVWVVANFKETQLRDMGPGQHASIHIDAYDVDLPAHVQSIQAGSGAQFSLLPPQNATGNFVKVVQRVPVKIVFDRPIDPRRYLLGPGMSVVARVSTR
ncbi:MAG: HlyD family secretion protein [Phycisphaerales bacterium]|nr:HlyD family secretion protein [Phycisphaerales bacterium]